MASHAGTTKHLDAVLGYLLGRRLSTEVSLAADDAGRRISGDSAGPST
jgi:hypothetical protein